MVTDLLCMRLCSELSQVQSNPRDAKPRSVFPYGLSTRTKDPRPALHQSEKRASSSAGRALLTGDRDLDVRVGPAALKAAAALARRIVDLHAKQILAGR